MKNEENATLYRIDNRNIRRCFLWLGFVSFLLFGLLFSGMILYCIRKQTESKNWPTADGEILTATYSSPGGRVAKYKSDVTYKYVVDKKDYIGKRIKFVGERKMFKSTIEELMSKYKTGKKLYIYYNPKEPEEAVLETDLSSQINSYILLLVFTFYIGHLFYSHLKKGGGEN